MSEASLRRHLVGLLSEANAHIDFEEVVVDFPVSQRGVRFDGYPHTPWQLLEHMRIAQWDILEFSRSAKHQSPDWPKDYWPKEPAPPTNEAWSESVTKFQQDLQGMIDLISDESNDLYAEIPHGDGQTLVREALVLAKHNSYHIGQLALIRKAIDG
ncbi:DinB family protein [bacterium]|nr:DinB family protein [bacterium]